MWFKVVFNKDGSVASCEESGPSISDGKHVFYVEADDKVKAISRARDDLSKLRRHHLSKREKHRASGLCVLCDNRAATGRVKCGPCLQRQKESRDRKRARGGNLTAEERARISSESLRKAGAAGGRAQIEDLQKPLEELRTERSRRLLRRAMAEVRDAFWRLSGPAFASWLDERIVALGGEARPKAAE
jgi:hypothetical protein